MKRVFLLLFAALLAAGFSGCAKAPGEETNPETDWVEPDVSAMANARIQITNLFFYDGRVYRAEEGQLVSYLPDLSDRIVLADDCDKIVDVSDERVWFLFESRLFTLKMGEATPELLTGRTEEEEYFKTTKGWIYYLDLRISKADGHIEDLRDGYVVATWEDKALLTSSENLMFMTDSNKTPTVIMKHKTRNQVVFKNKIYFTAAGTFKVVAGSYRYTPAKDTSGAIFRYDPEKNKTELLTTELANTLYPTDDGLFFTDYISNQLKWIPKGSHQPEMLTDQEVGVLCPGSLAKRPFGYVDGWLYCTSRPDYKLMRINPQTKSVETLTQESVGMTWVEGDRLYYQPMALAEDGNLASQNLYPRVMVAALDGSGAKVAAEFAPEELVAAEVVAPYIYSVHRVKSRVSYLDMGLDGSGLQTVSKPLIFDSVGYRYELIAEGKRFYIRTGESGAGLVVTGNEIRYSNPDGSDDRVFYNGRGYNFSYADGWLYFYIEEKIYRIREGGTPQLVADSVSSRPFLLCGKRVVFFDLQVIDQSRMYSAKAEGGGRTLLWEGDIAIIGTDKDGLYFTTGKEIRYIRADGKDWRQVYYETNSDIDTDSDTEMADMALLDDWIYSYQWLDERDSILRINCSTGKVETLLRDYGKSFSSSGQAIYYIGGDGRLYRLDPETLTAAAVNGEPIDAYYLADGRILARSVTPEKLEAMAFAMDN